MDAVSITALIVDDEPIARHVLREELEACPEVRVVGEAADGKAALEAISELRPDVVFLDLQMPVMSGFDVVRKLSGPALPVIVIVTAFDQHAIPTFDAGAVDYLLKPVGEARLRTAVERARALVGKPAEIASRIDQVASAQPSGPKTLGKIVGRSGEEYFLLDLDDVLAFQAEPELVWIVTARQRFLATQTLRAIEARLADSRFKRVHRNALVKVGHVRKMRALSGQRWLITLSNSLQVTVSERQAHQIRQVLQW